MTRLGEIRDRFRREAVDRNLNPRDVDLLLCEVLDRPTTYLISHAEDPLSAEQVDRFTALLQRRFRGEPLQYIQGRTEFYSREFVVDGRVLIPRPETELLVERALGLAPDGGAVVDVGTGIGCIGITLERERPDLRVLALDRSFDALMVARMNRDRLGSRALLLGSDLLSAIRGPVDMIVSNPPYIPADEVRGLDPVVREWEPAMALTPGAHGTEVIESLFKSGGDLLNDSGRMIFEIGFGQESAVRGLAARLGWRVEEMLSDLAGIPRVVVSSRS